MQSHLISYCVPYLQIVFSNQTFPLKYELTISDTLVL
jgi:hypothetical protein